MDTITIFSSFFFLEQKNEGKSDLKALKKPVV